MLVTALLMVTVIEVEVALALLVSPPYTAVKVCTPTAKLLVENVAAFDARVPLPSVFAPSLNVTVPDADIPPESTAFNVTALPYVAVLADALIDSVGAT